MRSPLKWTGSKAKLVKHILDLMPQEYNCYYEPFLGSGVVLLNVNPKQAFCSDIIPESPMVMEAIKDDPKGIKEQLRKYTAMLWTRGGEFYYIAREEYNSEKGEMPTVDRAALFIFLVRSGFNGLIRFNKDNCWNVPWGKRGSKKTNGCVYTEEYGKVIMEASRILNEGKKLFDVCSFEDTIRMAGKGDIIYADPPYLSTDYNRYCGFVWDEERERLLHEEIFKAHDRGAKFILSNIYLYKGKKNKKLLKIYKDFDHTIVDHQYIMGPNKNRRPKVSEVLIYS